MSKTNGEKRSDQSTNNQNVDSQQVTNKNNNLSPNEQENFAQRFAKNVRNFNPYLTDPQILNQNLKQLNMNPADLSREKVLEMIKNPHQNEKELRRLGQFLYNTQMSYKRMVHYLSDILTFDWYPVPIEANYEDMQSSKFQKDYERMCQWFDSFNVEKEFKKATLKMATEDGYFTYIREDDDGDRFLQEMPIDYCMIDSSWKHGYLYSFNMMYFQQPGVDINGFAPEFKDYYNNVMDMHQNGTYYPGINPEMRSAQWAYWQQMNPGNSWVFKFHDHFAGLIPPFLGVFLDFLDLPNLKDMQNAKSELELYKLIMGTVPRNKDNKSGNQADDFAIDADTLGEFVKLVKNGMNNEHVDFKAVPLENLEMFSFDEAVNKDNALTSYLNNISNQTGIDQSLLNTESPNVATMNMSKLIDSAFIERLYSQFEDFCTHHVNKMTKTYNFKIKMLGTIHDKDDRKTEARRNMEVGYFTPKMAAQMETPIHEMESGMNLMKSLGFPNNLTPAPTSHTMSGNSEDDNGGRPEKEEDDLTDSGSTTRSQGSNEEKTEGDG